MSATHPAPLPVRRSRLLAACALLVALAMVQDPGLLVADTKFDLVADPADWLRRSLHVWDAEGGFGQVQNQAHGYLWPMGPFFLLGDVLGLPGWVVQRLWQGLVLSVALVGMAKLVRALGGRSDLACLVAGFAYALSPRMLTSLGPISIEVWPSALVPWVLLPLVRGSESGSPRRAAALSALAVAMVGGVNAAASFAVVPLAVIWILTRTRGPRRRSLMLWWPVFTALGTAWWIVPLLVMGAYSPPFLDFTETTAVTTFPTTLFDTLRGTSHWVPYVDVDSRAGNEILGTSWLAINTGVVVLLGLVGLLDRRTPHRTFLVVSLLAGVLTVTAGHQGVVEGWFAGSIAEALDGVLAPLRNLHKFDPVLRVPLLVGMAFVLDRAVAAWGRRPAPPRAERLNAAVLVGALLLAVVGTATPALGGRVEPRGATLGVPAYWDQAAQFLARSSEGGTALLVPGSAHADYLWGDPNDEPLQWLAGSRWAVRSAAILAEPGHVRMLDGLGRRFAEGDGSAGLTAALRRAGVEHVVVRNDLEPGNDVPEPALVHEAIAESPGLVRVRSFGPEIGGTGFAREGEQRYVFEGGRRASYPAVEVFAVRGGSWPAVSAGEPSFVASGPEDLPDLLDAGVVGSAPVHLAGDADPADGADRPRRVVLTDGLRARERMFGRVHDGVSTTLTPGDERRTAGPTRDFVLGANEDDRWSTTARLEGARAISASSSRADADALGGSDRGTLPFAALDGDPETAWTSTVTDRSPWWRVELEVPRHISYVTVTAAPRAGPQALRVVTAHGASRVVELSPGGTRRVRLPAERQGVSRTSWIQLEDTGDAPGSRLAVAELAVRGLDVRRVLDLPALPEGWRSPDVVALQADRDGRTGCVDVAGRTRCTDGEARSGEDGPVLRRSFHLGASRSYDVSATAFPRAGAELDSLLLEGQPAAVRASSTAVRDPRAGAVAAIDGDPATTWSAAPDDEQAELRINWLGVRRVRGLTIAVDDGTAARRPQQVLLRFSRGDRTVERAVTLDADGSATFTPVRADGVEVRVLSAEPVLDVGSDGSLVDAPVGVGEITLRGVPYLPLDLPAKEKALECGSGPDLHIGDVDLRTSVRASPLDLMRGAEVPATVCGARSGVELEPGSIDVEAERAGAFDAGGLVLTATDDPGESSPPSPADLQSAGPVERLVTPASDATVVALRESANPGWVARQDGQVLRGLVLDGWQQAFVLEGEAPVVVSFAPDRPYRAGLLAGGAAALVLLGAIVLLGMRQRGKEPAALGDRRLPAVVGMALGSVVAGLVAGTTGFVIAVAVIGATTALRTRIPDGIPWLLASPLLVTATAYALRPWGSEGGWAGSWAWAGYLVVVPLAALALSEPRRSGKRPFRRIAGRSTTR